MVEGLRVAIMPTRGTDLIFIQAGFVGIRWRHFIGRADMPRELFTLEEVAERFPACPLRVDAVEKGLVVIDES